MGSIRLVMVWDGRRPLSQWERRCIARAEELFSAEWLPVKQHLIPLRQFRHPQGPSEWVRWQVLKTPYTLYSDCDVWWHRVPQCLGEMFLCDDMRGGFRPNDAVVWSGAYPQRFTRQLWQVQRDTNKFVYFHKALRSVLRYEREERGRLWDFFPSDGARPYQHKES